MGVKLLVKVCLVFGPVGVWKLEVRDVTREWLAGFLDAWGKSGSRGW